MAGKKKSAAMNFKGMPQRDVPQGRHGKHKPIITKILSDLDQIPAGVALQIPLGQLADGKDRVRSALNRATRKLGRIVATASDETFLYVWNESPGAVASKKSHRWAARDAGTTQPGRG